jgi:hypothetical protein
MVSLPTQRSQIVSIFRRTENESKIWATRPVEKFSPWNLKIV